MTMVRRGLAAEQSRICPLFCEQLHVRLASWLHGASPLLGRHVTMLRNRSNNAMQFRITTTALQTVSKWRPASKLPLLLRSPKRDRQRQVPFSANARVVALSLGFFLPKQQVSEDTREGRVEPEGRRWVVLCAGDRKVDGD